MHKLKRKKVLNSGALTSRNTHIASFARKYHAALSSCVYSERLSSEDGNFYEEKRNWLLPMTGK